NTAVFARFCKAIFRKFMPKQCFRNGFVPTPTPPRVALRPASGGGPPGLWPAPTATGLTPRPVRARENETQPCHNPFPTLDMGNGSVPCPPQGDPPRTKRNKPTPPPRSAPNPPPTATPVRNKRTQATPSTTHDAGPMTHCLLFTYHRGIVTG